MGLLKLENLHVALENGTEIVKGVDLEVDLNEVHAVMGPNGSGKSTLANAIMGHPAYEITEGRILLDGEDVTELGADELPAQRDQLGAQGPKRRRRGPDADSRVPHGAAGADGPPEGQPRARVALPE